MARLYTDENFPIPAAEELRRLGHDVLTIQEDRSAGVAIPDELVLDLALRHQRALVTLNRKHFVRLHQVRPGHVGIIVRTFDHDFKRQAQRIHAALETEPQLAGKLLRVNRPSS
jgi:Domain of unknown function (DUF5615)